jgi:hypothetical protein
LTRQPYFANFPSRRTEVPFTVPFADPAATESRTALANTTAGVISAIRDGSASSGMNFDVMLAAASMESGLDPAAHASTSSATGLFQFIDQTWLEEVRQYGPQHGIAADAALVVRRDGRFTVDDPNARQRILDLRKNPEIASAIAGDHLRAISDKLGLTLGRAPDATEIYLGHLLGGGGASQVLHAARTSPNQAASDLLPDAARANSNLFYAPDGTPYTVTQFMQHLRARVGRAYAAVGAVMPAGPINLAATRPAASGLKLAGTTNAAPPMRSRQPLEREAIANLTKVFARLDSATRGGESAVRHHGNSQNSLPAALLTTLRGTPAGKAA